MIKRTIISIIVVFIAWSLLDIVIHGVLLQRLTRTRHTCGGQ